MRSICLAIKPTFLSAIVCRAVTPSRRTSGPQLAIRGSVVYRWARRLARRGRAEPRATPVSPSMAPSTHGRPARQARRLSRGGLPGYRVLRQQWLSGGRRRPRRRTSRTWARSETSEFSSRARSTSAIAFGRPSSSSRKNRQRARFETSTVSKSITSMVPTPTRARFLTTSLPSRRPRRRPRQWP